MAVHHPFSAAVTRQRQQFGEECPVEQYRVSRLSVFGQADNFPRFPRLNQPQQGTGFQLRLVGHHKNGVFRSQLFSRFDPQPDGVGRPQQRAVVADRDDIRRVQQSLITADQNDRCPAYTFCRQCNIQCVLPHRAAAVGGQQLVAAKPFPNPGRHQDNCRVSGCHITVHFLFSEGLSGSFPV